jgi:hypothetical protein
MKSVKNRKANRPEVLDVAHVERVLEGRVRPSARDMLTLIHDVNPSGLELPARETARRYAFKNRLQSLLINRFGDEILIEPTDDPNIIGLRHRASGVDACHAVIASLDDDARSFAQRKLDLGEGDDDPSPLTALPEEPDDDEPAADAPLEDLSTDELLKRGRVALRDYDYERARECFAAAFERGRREAGVLLLTVLAEHLALDDEALALEERLDDDALADPEVRLMLALASARTYDRARAIRLARADVGDAAAEVFVALARGALSRDDLAHAASDVGEIQRRGPSHPALIGLADAVKKRRADARTPLEAEAQRLFGAGLFDDAEARADEIVARWPESAPAHAILRAGQERRRRDEGRALASEGAAALEAGEGARAVALLRRAALALRGDDVEAVRRDLAKAEAREREQAEAMRAAGVAQLLEAGHMLRGLTEYVALDDERRALVKARKPVDELLYVDAIGVRGAGPDAKGAAQAAMALSRAVLCSPTDPSAAFDLIAMHWGFLQKVEIAGQIAALVNESRRLREMSEAIQRYTAGLQAFDGTPEGITRSLKLLATVKRDHLDDPAEFDQLYARFRRAEERLKRAQEVGKLRDAGNLVGARDALDALIKFEDNATAIDPDDPSGNIDWRAKRADVVETMAKVCDLRVSGAPGAEAPIGLEILPQLDVRTAVFADANELVLGESRQGLLFFLVLDVATSAVLRRATMRMRSVFEVARIQQRAGRVAILGSSGMCVEVHPVTWELERAISAGEGRESQSVLAPGGRFVWNTTFTDGWWTAVTVEDTERGVYVKNYSEAIVRLSVRPLLGVDEPRVVAIRDRGSLTVYEARGALFGTTQDKVPALPQGVVVHPTGKGLLALLRDGDALHGVVRWAELTSDGTPVRGDGQPLAVGGAPVLDARTIPGLDPDAHTETATALDQRAVFVLGSARDGVRRLVALVARALPGASGAPADRIEVAFDVEVPVRAALAQDPRARRVVLLSPHDGGLELAPLGATPPVLRATPPPAPPIAHSALCLSALVPCAPPGAELWTVSADGGVATLPLDYLTNITGEERRAMIARVLTEADDRPLVAARHARLLGLSRPSFASDFEAAVAAQFPGDPEMAQVPAQRAAVAGEWEAVRERLEPVDVDALPEAAAKHHEHLLGAALLVLGDAVGAREVLERASRRTGPCDLAALLALAGVDSADDSALADAPAAVGMRHLVGAVRSADAHLAAGALARARAALAGLVVREAREVQSLARLCRAWLAEPDESAETDPNARLDGFARRFALAGFLAAHDEKQPARRRELPIPGARWDAATLDALAAEARAWLDADQQRPRT